MLTSVFQDFWVLFFRGFFAFKGNKGRFYGRITVFKFSNGKGRKMKLRYKILIFTCVAVLLTLGLAAVSSALAPPPVPLDPTTVPKYTDQLVIPPVYQPTVTTDGNGNTIHEYTVSEEQFTQQILPAGYPMTTVFGYKGPVQSPGGPVMFQNTPSATFEAVRGIPVKVHWVNNLVSQILPVDPTIMWANPNNMATPTAPFSSYPPGYPDAQSPVPTVTHLHGGEDRSDSDGGPESWVTSTGSAGPTLTAANHTAPNTATFDYPNGQQPTTLWYHDHALGLTRINVLSGLAGFYLLRDPADTVAASLPSGQYEVPIAIQDRSFYDDGSIALTSTGVNPDVHPDWDPEYFGDTIMVNGKLWPNFNVEQHQYRFRILNGSNARFYNLALSNGQSFTQIGSDGGYLPVPVTATSLLIAPGERADILIDFSALAPGAQVTLTNDAAAPYPSGPPADPATTGQIMRFTVTGGPVVTPAPLPATLNTIPALTPDSPGRTLTLNENLSASGGPLQLLLNGQPYSGSISETPAVGATEDWDIVNLTGDTHPIHLHLVQFQVVSRTPFDAATYDTDWQTLNGGPPPFNHPTSTLPVAPYLTGAPAGPDANETGWKDTVRMNPGEITRIRVRFAPQDATGTTPNVNSFPFDPTYGPGYVWHCHIVDHEDNEMMRPMGIIQTGKPALSLQKKAIFWASYADYTSGHLTATLSVINGTGGTAKNVQITGASGNMGVTSITTLPLNMGDLASGGSSDITLVYSIPPGTAHFSTGITAVAADTAGNSYTYP